MFQHFEEYLHLRSRGILKVNFKTMQRLTLPAFICTECDTSIDQTL